MSSSRLLSGDEQEGKSEGLCGKSRVDVDVLTSSFVVADIDDHLCTSENSRFRVDGKYENFDSEWSHK